MASYLANCLSVLSANKTDQQYPLLFYKHRDLYTHTYTHITIFSKLFIGKDCMFSVGFLRAQIKKEKGSVHQVFVTSVHTHYL